MNILQVINVPKELQQNSPDVLATGVDHSAKILFANLPRRMGRPDLGDLDLLEHQSVSADCSVAQRECGE